MIIEYLKDGKKMLKNKILFVSNISSNLNSLNPSSSAIPNTLFELMKNNVLLVNSNCDSNITISKETNQNLPTNIKS